MRDMASVKLSPEPMNELITFLKERLKEGASFDNPRLTAAANRFFGGTRGEGRFDPRTAYDAVEAAVHWLLLETYADHLWRSPVTEALDFLQELAARLPTQSDRTQAQVDLQQFSSPIALAYIAAKLLNPQPGELIAEPSAGTGALAIWAKAAGAGVFCNELDERRRRVLALLGFDSTDYDAEFIDDFLPEDIKPKGVLMNPPFSSTSGRVVKHDTMYGARHVESALKRLEPGGRLVAITSAAMSMKAPKFSEWWQKIARTYNVRANFTVAGRVYAKQGTSVPIQIVVIDKDGSTPGDTWRDKLETIKWSEADSIEGAWDVLKDLCVREDRAADDERDENETKAEMFTPYLVPRLTGAMEHPTPIVEATSMAAIMPPPFTYKLSLPRWIIEKRFLSAIQLESVILAGQQHERRLPNGARAAFCVGHGTGVGKGRILAAIIIDNWLKGRKRAIWLSVSRDLIEAARRDLEDLGFGAIPLKLLNEYTADEEIRMKEGVIFLTYSTLIAGSRGGQKRIDQVQQWLGKDGVVIFDEAHKAKNALATGQGDPTQTGQAVCDLQDPKKNPDYRFVYSSATGATDVRNMAYMLRLGLSGEGTQFSSFSEFMAEIDGGGVAAMEMICRHLRSSGQYASGSISFGVDPASGLAVEYSEVVHKLTPEQRMMYDNAAKAWQAILKRIDDAIEETNGGPRERARAISNFWASQQRFFNQVITAFKIPSLIKRIETARADGRSVIISLVGTGEARTADKVSKAIVADESLDDLDFSPREIIGDMILRSFPVTLYEDVDDPTTDRTIKVVKKDKDGNPAQSREALKMRTELLDRISTLHIPDNPLDQIINHFGQSNVAEITGRSRCLIRDPHTGKTEYKKRAPEGVAMDKVNLYEMDQFQSGKKRISIISDAGSMGISLHASNEAENQDRREQIVLQFGWSADKEMQRFGRSHRSNQKYPPIYTLLTTEIGGERRFVSTIARRLGSLGALTKGERRSVDVADISQYNFETDEGRAALSYMFASIMRGEEVPGINDPKQALRDMGLLEKDWMGRESIRREHEKNVPRFLNRVLTLEVDRQNAMFDHFFNLFHRAIEIAKAQGTFDEGVTDIKAEAIRLAQPPRVVAVDAATGAKTIYYNLDVDQRSRRVSFERAMEEVEKRGAAFFLHVKRQEIILAVPSRSHTDVETGRTYETFSIWKPERPRADHWRDDELRRKRQLLQPEEARAWWERRHAEVPEIETWQRHVIGGSIFTVWKRLKRQADAKLQVIRATTSSGQRIVGAAIPAGHIGPTLRALGIARHLIDPHEIFNAVWKERDQIELVEDILIRQASVHKEKRIEVVTTNYYHFANLRLCDLINEMIDHRQRFFVSTEEEEGIHQITKLLEIYPPIRPTKGATAETVADDTNFTEEPPVNIFDLLLPVDEEHVRPRFEPVKENRPSAPLPQSNKVKAPAGNSHSQRPATKPRKALPGKNDQLAFDFNNADTNEDALEALSAMIAKAASTK